MNYSLDTMLSIYRLLNKRGQVRKGMLEAMGCGEYPVKLSELRRKKTEAIRQGKQYEAEDYGLEIDKLTGCYKEKVKVYFKGISQSLLKENLRIAINKGEHGDKPVYEIEKRVENMVLMKLLNKDLQRCYRVQPANRNAILQQLKLLLEEHDDFYLLRLDIQSFYESVPFKELLDKLEDDSLLCSESLYLLEKIENTYQKLSHCSTGIPRGVNCSPFLAELFMRDIDTRIMEMEGVFYYQRYVDDIIVLVSPGEKKVEEYYDDIDKLMASKKLKLHSVGSSRKTLLVDSRVAENVQFDYLGYQIAKKGDKVEFLIAESKMEKYQQKIQRAVERFVTHIGYHKKGKSSPLHQLLVELRLLTSNYELSGSKRGIQTGIRHKYSLLTNLRQLLKLDSFLKYELQKITPAIIPDGMGKLGNVSFTKEEYAAFIQKRCRKYSFLTGYKECKTSRISPTDFRIYKSILRQDEKNKD